MLLQRLERLVLPPVCVVCDGRGHDADICTDCARELPWNRVCCPRCALPLAQPVVCGVCLATPPPWQTALSPLLYEFPVPSLLQRFKFARHLAAGRMLALLFAQWSASAATRPDCLVPVPLHWRRRLLRHFNQAGEIAHTVGSQLRLPVVDACRRTRATPAQSGLGARDRKRNLRDAFEVKYPVEGLHIALVDDVLTTGSTAAELARTLMRQGAKRVDVWTLARARRQAGSAASRDE